jgi:Outer membrane lipoprotein
MQGHIIVTSRFVCILAAGLLVAACATPTSSRYEGAEVGRPIETTRGTILSGRVVQVTGETNAAGPLAGAAIGGASVGLGTQSGWAAVLGAVVGAGIGYATQQVINDRDGIEYVIEMEDGRTVTLVQNRDDEETPLNAGTPVLVQVSGQYSRVIPRAPAIDRPNMSGGLPGSPPPAVGSATGAVPSGAGGTTGGWVDPDRPNASQAPATAKTPLPPPAPAQQGTQGAGAPSAPFNGSPPANQLLPTTRTAESGRATSGPYASNVISSWAVPPHSLQ